MRRLLAHETLSPRQMWWVVMADMRSIEAGSASSAPESVLIIADTQEQVLRSVQAAGRDPWLAINEEHLRAAWDQALPTITKRLAQAALRVTGLQSWWSPMNRYGLAIASTSDIPPAAAPSESVEPPALTWHWVSAPSAAAAIEDLESRGVHGTLDHLVDLQAVRDVLDHMSTARARRGAGVWTDARFLGSLLARRRALHAEHVGGDPMAAARRAARRASLGRPGAPEPSSVEFPA